MRTLLRSVPGLALVAAAVSSASIVALAASPQAPAAAPPDGPKQKFQRVADGVYAGLPAPGSDVSANSAYIIGKDTVWVFEALRPEIVKEMLVEIRKQTKLPIRYVINSHHHYELVMGNNEFAGATIVAHENVRKNLIATPPAAQIERTRQSNQSLGLPQGNEGQAPPVRLPELTYADKIVFHDGDRELQLIHLGRYHTDADSVLYLPREKILFSGDLLPGIGGPGGQREAHFREFVQSIDRALALDFETIVPGRGERLATKQDLRNFQQYLKDLLAAVQTYVDRGATADEALAGIKPPPYIDATRLETPSFKRLWADGVRRAHAELSAGRKK